MKKLSSIAVLSIFLLNIAHTGFSQVNEPEKRIIIDQNSEKSEWVLYDNSQGLEVYYKVEDCQSQNTGIIWKVLYFKLVNSTEDQEYHIIWDYRKYEGETCLNCYHEDYEDSINLIIGPGETYVNDCSYPEKNKLGIYLGSEEYPGEPWTDSVVLENYAIHFLRTIKTGNNEE
jgi:hypothetical protein